MDVGAIEIRESRDGCRLRVRVRPSARSDAILGPHGGALKLSVTAPPERGRANAAVVALVAAALRVPARRVSIASGGGSPNKTLSLEGLSADEVRGRLARLDVPSS